MDINVELVYSTRIRGLQLRVTGQGRVRLIAPPGTPRSLLESFLADKKPWLEECLKTIGERQTKKQSFYDRLPLQTRRQHLEATRRLQPIVEPMIERHGCEMGVMPRRVTFRATTSRWGSCNHALRTINLSLYLLLLPEWCVEHVVVHELAHLIVPDHSQRFYDVMDRHFPRWREARETTRRLARADIDAG